MHPARERARHNSLQYLLGLFYSEQNPTQGSSCETLLISLCRRPADRVGKIRKRCCRSERDRHLRKFGTSDQRVNDLNHYGPKRNGRHQRHRKNPYQGPNEVSGCPCALRQAKDGKVNQGQCKKYMCYLKRRLQTKNTSLM